MGDLEEETVKALFSTTFERERVYKEDEHIKQTKQKYEISEPKEIVEKQNVQQAKLHIGFRTNCTFKDKEYAAMQLFNGIFGGFPSSKLFLNVREKHSLAYYASSRLESHKGLLLVFSGIAPKDYEQARDVIFEQLEAMKNGEITEEEMKQTKELIVSQLLETLDHPQGIIEILYQQVIAQQRIRQNN
ncbi:M16 family metallopeptidase [Paracerasibacillus soli]|uniref:Insulinase family protein n=1 Tax=Paracerasibacillus soli TaxID=480284 RepID=A0ABU5CPE5_9BACI|nr:insulinase family protein [Virgibacillus soli]MDY0408210.1 insulinase family protein [Virgibacillus soli]